MTNLEIAKRCLAAIERREDITEFYATDVVQIEWPNSITPNGAMRTLPDLMKAAEAGKRVMSAERYEVWNEVASGDMVALEATWTGTLSVAYGQLPVGGEMKAHLAIFMKFREGKIVEQRNYDCFA